MLITSLGLANCSSNKEAMAEAAKKTVSQGNIELECAVEQISPDPGYNSGIDAVYRLVKYRVEQVCSGDYTEKEIVVDHLIMTGNELEGLKVGDQVCITVKRTKDIPTRWDAEGIRESSEVIESFYVKEKLERSNCTCH